MDDRLDSLWRSLGARTDYERCARPRASRFSLDGMRALVAALGHPQRSFAVLHIAGSKGKGTLAHALAHGLQRAGFRTGLYLSPHLSDWRERIQVDGNFAPDAILADALQAVLARAQGGETFFDLLTAAAFESFRRCEVEIAVVEVGLGGRADSTNVVDPLAAVVTSIEGEHLEVLGPTLDHVAAEKAGVFKPGAALWRGEDLLDSARAVLEQHAAALGSELRNAVEQPVPIGLLAHPLPHVRRHGALAVALLAQLRTPWSRAAEALAAAPTDAWEFPGRWERRLTRDGRLVIFDVAHTERSLRAVLAAFRAQHPDPATRGVLFAMREEKDPYELAAALGLPPPGERWWAAPAGDHPRSADPKRLAAAFGAQPLAAPVLPEGVTSLLVTGSTYLVGALRPTTRRVPAQEFAAS